jgi:multicomponent Na+:H+ antiporter subunit E
MSRALAVAGLLAVFLRELALSAWSVIRLVVTLDPKPRPALLAVPLDVRSDAGIALFANLVTLTPGTTSVHVSADRRTLFVHALDVDDEAAAIASMKQSFERRVLQVLP